MNVIERYVIELPISGGIMELTGEMAQLVFTSRTGLETRLSELLEDAEYESFAEKIARLEGVWRELISRVAHSEAAEVAQAKLLARLLGDLVYRRSHDGWIRRAVAGLELRVANVLSRQMRDRRPLMAQAREQHLLELLDPELVRSAVDEIWSSVASLPLVELFQYVSKQDVEDFVVLSHEFWLSYRKSPYFRRIAQEMVEHFFAKYGQHTVLALIEDMGVDETMVARELRELLGPVLDKAAQSGALERQLRAQLATFYSSSAFDRALHRE
jgi:acyl carrier protein phosphodiesterase